ncbi:MAG TPA: nucleotidyltransferase family protein [Candidatus Polarisedimenticolia bacterium]|nr:nucleotidyltransferase family protein [Candidatus Polarisedimenticolia bacterium]
MIVLAAGASERMGAPKPLLPFEGQTCLSLVLDACLSSSATETVVVIGPDASDIRDALASYAASRKDARIRLALNTRPQRGQTSSLKTGIDESSGRADGFAVFPVDHPLVMGADVDQLVARFEQRPRGRTIFIPTHDDRRGHPVLFSAAHRGPILELGDDAPLHEYVRLKGAEIDLVPVDNPGVVTGMNTPEEYQRALALYRERSRRA